MDRTVLLQKASFQSVYVEPRFDDQGLSHATGFVVTRPDGSPLLITNWHVVSGRHFETRELLCRTTAAIPNYLRVQHNLAGALGTWISVIERLYDDEGKPRWLEHPQYGAGVDVVGLPLTQTANVDLYTHSYTGPTWTDPTETPPDVNLIPSDLVSVIGFPFGFSGGGGLGVWVQGAVATEPDLDYKDLPRFLIDSRTRSGQSGSPVVLYKRNTWATLSDGRPRMIGGPLTLLLGVYSGRLHKDSDLGTVWKTSVVAAIATDGRPGSMPEA